jgi:anaerobic selenocysteine-containing dehydrogenase
MAMLHASGRRTDLLMARAACNTAGIETCGAAVEYLPGRQPVPVELTKVTPDRDVLLSRIVNGEIKAALVFGEDPLRNNKVRQYLVNVKFLAAMADTMSETATAADIVLPAATYLEEPGTRVNFEGQIVEFSSVLDPPSGRPGWQVLAGLAGAFGLLGIPNSVEQVRDKLRQAVRAGYGKYTQFYWNTGEPRRWEGPLAFQRIELRSEAHAIANYLTLIQRYKQDASVIGIKHFRLAAEEARVQ